ncbi:MAG: allophanate hydrolase [Pseudomonadota bacterium]
MTYPIRFGVAKTAASVNDGTKNAVSIMSDTLTRIDSYDAIQPQVWISRPPPEQLLEAAEVIDRRIANGEQLPLAGVPYAAKDNIDVEGSHTTAGCPAFSYAPSRSAEVISRLTAAGAICVGKTNLDQFATGLVGTRSPYGIPSNPYNREFISGGSSSGSAVAVAAGLVAFSLGTDTAGSGRVPAAFNHLIGFKPTKARWSTRGLVPACRTLDCITAFTSSADDTALIDHVLAGFDADDPFSKPLNNRALKSERIGVPRREQRVWFGDTQSEYYFDQAVSNLASVAEIVEFDIEPLMEVARLLYSGPWIAERTAAIFDLLSDNPGAIDDTVRTIIAGGNKISAVDAFKGQYRLAELKRKADRIWEEFDAIAFPTTGTTYRKAEIAAAPIALNSNLGFYTNFVNLLDMAAVSVPAGVRLNRTGFGLTLIGPADSDLGLLNLANDFLNTADEICPPPLDMEGNVETVKLAVVGAHLKDMPLHWQLSSRDAVFVGEFQTAASYRLFAMEDTTPPKPALVHCEDGTDIAVEVYELDLTAFGSFVAEVPAPLAIGTVTLSDGSSVKGFVSEPRATAEALDITELGGWRAYIASKQA